MRKSAIVVLLIGGAASSGIHAADGTGSTFSGSPVTPAFLPLAPGAVEPRGWLRDWAVSMRDGMTGHLDEYDPVFQSAWTGQRIGTTGGNASGEGWPLEQSAYWIDGAVRLGHVLHDPTLLDKVVPRLEKLAGAGNRNGSFLWWRGQFSWDGQDGAAIDEFNLWSCAVLGRAFIAQYEATGDRKWLTCIERFFATMPGKALFPISRRTVNLEIQRIVPNYIIHMWMKTPDHGLAATLYGPCSVRAVVADGTAVSLTCATDYPFGEDLVVTVTPAQPQRFPLYFRIPDWCPQPSFTVNGTAVGNAESSNGFLRIARIWSPGDTVAIRFPMPPRVVKGRETGGSPYACVYAGPLLFARGIPEMNENGSLDTGWRYALDFECAKPPDGMKINRRALPAKWDWPYAAPVAVTVPAQAIDWAPIDKHNFPLPDAPVAGRYPEMIELIPYGCAKFRVSMFPVTAKAWGPEP